jgi:hypothetical protein
MPQALIHYLGHVRLAGGGGGGAAAAVAVAV